MKEILDKLYYSELESGRLDPEQDPEYQLDAQEFEKCYDWLWDHLNHKKCDELYTSVMAMQTSSEKAAFHYGLRLGLRLALWAERSDPTTGPACL